MKEALERQKEETVATVGKRPAREKVRRRERGRQIDRQIDR